ncbi:MAG: hypothetical protein IKM08_01390 [Clostridia bacterium]|nr:hypothetical protein [Clostridia bacterium]
MATIFNRGTLTFTPAGGTQTSVASNITGTELDVSYGLEVSHGVSPESYVVGDVLRYTVVLRNTGSGVLVDPVVTVDLAGGALDYAQGSAVAFLYQDDVTEYPLTVSENGTLTVSLAGPLPAGATAFLLYDAAVSGLVQGTDCELVSTATATANEGSADGPEISDSDTATANCTPITLIKSAPESAAVGETVSFVFSVTNNTGASIGLDSLTDQLPEQFSLTAVTLTQDGTTVPLTEGSDYTVENGFLDISPSGTFVLQAGQTVQVNLIGVITA